jgi:hypothetical protein
MVGTTDWFASVGTEVVAGRVAEASGTNWVVMAITVSAAAVLTAFGPAVGVALLLGRLQLLSNRATSSTTFTVARVLFMSSPVVVRL